MGRYIERSEHIARYLNVNYFSSLDAPNEQSQSRQFVLKSMRYMLGEQTNESELLKEEETLYDIGLNPERHYSIISNVKAVRENANSARDLISTELYESINKFYHFVLNYDVQLFVKKGLYDFTVNITEKSAILRGKIRASLLHDEVYAIIMMGINIERATQVIRITNAKYHDATIARDSLEEHIAYSFEWTTLLKCAEAYDMMRRYYKKPPTIISTLEFVILNPDCPRSVMNSLDQICKHVHVLDKTKRPKKNSTAFLVGKLRAEFQYMKVEEIETDVQGFIARILNKLFEISKQMEDEFFKF